MKVLITGGTGFIGSYCARAFAERGVRLGLLDLYPPEQPLPDDAEFVRGDVRDPEAVQRALDGCDAVLHLAAAHHDTGIDRDTFFSVNETGTRVLCSAMSDRGVRDLMFLSSTAVYGASGRHDEQEPPAPLRPYGESKVAAERVVQDWCGRDAARSAVILRPTVVFGPGNHANMFKLIRQIDSRIFFPVGNGRNRKSMAYVENLVGAMLHVWERRSPGVAVYNYVDKPDMTSREIVSAVYAGLGRTAPARYLPLRAALTLVRPLDLVAAAAGRTLPISGQGVRKLSGVTSVFEASRILEAGWQPQVSLEEGIRRMVEWYRVAPRPAVEMRLPPKDILVNA